MIDYIMFNDNAFNGDTDNIVDLLYDLKHDLGKYIVLPVAMLPASSDSSAVKKALYNALYKTRVKGDESVSALQIWNGYKYKIKKQLSCELWSLLNGAVDKVLALDMVVSSESFVHRDTVLKELTGLSDTIFIIIKRVEM